MAAIFNLIEEIKSFHLFEQLSNLLIFEKNIRSKLWTREILTNTLNEIISKFLNSNFEKIDYFFEFYLQSLYDNSNKMKKFCYTLLLSMIYFKKNYNYIELYYKLFKEHSSKSLYTFFKNCKEIIFSMQNVTNTNFANLDSIYIKDKEWIYILNNNLNLNLKEIKKFKERMQNKVKQAKHNKYDKVLRYCRNNQYSLCFFLKEVCEKFSEIKKLRRKEMLMEKFEYEDEDDYEEEDDSEIEEEYKNRKFRKNKRKLNKAKGSLNTDFMTNDEKLLKKKKIVEEIKGKIKLTNQYKISCIRMISYLDQIDPKFTDIKKLLKKTRDILNTIKKQKIQGKKHENFINRSSTKVMSFLDRGTSLKDNHCKKIMRELLMSNKDQYKMINLRKNEHIPHIKKLIRNLSAKIFSEKFSLFSDKQNKNMENLQRELEKIFGRYNNLKNSDYFILNTVFQNYDSRNNNELSMDNVLDKVSSKLLNMVDNVLGGEESSEDEEDMIIEDVEEEKKNENDFDIKRSEKIDKNLLSQITQNDDIREKSRLESKIVKEKSPESKKTEKNYESKKIEIKKSDKKILEKSLKKNLKDQSNENGKEKKEDQSNENKESQEDLFSEGNSDYINRIQREATDTDMDRFKLEDQKREAKKNEENFQTFDKKKNDNISESFQRSVKNEVGVFDLLPQNIDIEKLEKEDEDNKLRKKREQDLLIREKEKIFDLPKKKSDPFTYDNIRQTVPLIKKNSFETIGIGLTPNFETNDKDKSKKKKKYLSDLDHNHPEKETELKHKSEINPRFSNKGDGKSLLESFGVNEPRKTITDLKEDSERIKKNVEKSLDLDNLVEGKNRESNISRKSRKTGGGYTKKYEKKLSQDKEIKKKHSKLLNRISKLTDKSRLSLKQKDDLNSVSRKSINSRKSRYTQQNSFKNISNRTNKTVPINNDELIKKKRKIRQDLYDINKDIAKEKESLKKIKKSLKSIKSSKKSLKSKKSIKPKAKTEIVRDSITVDPTKRKTKISSTKGIDKEPDDIKFGIDEELSSSRRNFFKKNSGAKDVIDVNENDFDPFSLEKDKNGIKKEDIKIKKDNDIGSKINGKNSELSEKSSEKRNHSFGNNESDPLNEIKNENNANDDINNEVNNDKIKENENDNKDRDSAENLDDNNADDKSIKNSPNEANEGISENDIKFDSIKSLVNSENNKENSIKQSEIVDQKKKSIVKPPDVLLSNEPAITPENKPDNKLRDQTINQSDLNINQDTVLNSLELTDKNIPFDSKISEVSLKNKNSNLKSISEKDIQDEDNLTKNDENENISEENLTEKNDNNGDVQIENLESNKEEEDRQIENLESNKEEEEKKRPKTKLRDKSVITHKEIKKDRSTNRNSIIPHKEDLYDSHLGSYDSEKELEIRESELEKRISNFRQSEIVKSNLNEVKETRKTNLKLDESSDVNNKEIEKIRKKTMKNSLARDSINPIENNLDESDKSVSEKNKKFEESRLSEIKEREIKINFQPIGSDQNFAEILEKKEQTRFNSLISNKNIIKNVQTNPKPGPNRNKIQTTIEDYDDFKAELDLSGDGKRIDLDETIQLPSNKFNTNQNNNHGSEEGQIKNFFKQKFDK